VDAAAALAPIHACIPKPLGGFADTMRRVQEAQATLVATIRPKSAEAA